MALGYLRVKNESVKFARVKPAGFRILRALDQVSQACGLVLVITSGTDGERSDTDPHATGEAFDVSVANLTADQIIDVWHMCRGILGPEFTVLYEVPVRPQGPLAAICYVNPRATGPHFHLQRKKGTVWPPPAVPGTSAGV